MKIYDLIIIGSGPAGIFAAKTIINKGLSVLILEKGTDLNRRRDLTSGWFGHALFAMNRLELNDVVLNNSRATKEVFKLIQKISSQHNIQIFSENNKNKLCRLPDNVGRDLASYLFDSISAKADINFHTEVLMIERDGDLFVIKTSRATYKGKKCLVATGKNSVEWISETCNKLDIEKVENGVMLGVRVEVPTFRVDRIIKKQGDITVKGESAEVIDTRVNSFVGEWEESHVISAFGHSAVDKESRRTNFMVGFKSAGSVSESIRNIQIINVLANDKIKKERVCDFLEDKSILKHIGAFNNLKEVFIKMDAMLPSFINYAIMYIPEIRLRGILPVDEAMRTDIPHLYGAGECTTRVGNLIGAMASGLIVARTILKE